MNEIFDILLLIANFSLTAVILLFLPGFILTNWIQLAIKLDLLERFLLSILLSICITMLIAYFLSGTAEGLEARRLMIVNGGFLFYGILGTLVLLLAHKAAARNVLSFAVGQNQRMLVLCTALFAIFIGGTVVSAHNVNSADSAHAMTEFYMLPEQLTADGPVVEVDSTTRISIGIANKEHQDMGYHIESWVDGVRTMQGEPFVVPQAQTWQGELLLPEHATDAPVELLLFKETEAEAVASLRISLPTE